MFILSCFCRRKDNFNETRDGQINSIYFQNAVYHFLAHDRMKFVEIFEQIIKGSKAQQEEFRSILTSDKAPRDIQRLVAAIPYHEKHIARSDFETSSNLDPLSLFTISAYLALIIQHKGYKKDTFLSTCDTRLSRDIQYSPESETAAIIAADTHSAKYPVAAMKKMKNAVSLSLTYPEQPPQKAIHAFVQTFFIDKFERQLLTQEMTNFSLLKKVKGIVHLESYTFSHYGLNAIFERFDGDGFEVAGKIKQLTLPERITVAEQITEGLLHLHELGFIHWDIKPENCLFRKMVKGVEGALCDLNLSFSLLLKQSYHPNLLVGSYGNFHYAAPELFCTLFEELPEIKQLQKMDLFALGATLYALLLFQQTAWQPLMDDVEQEARTSFNDNYMAHRQDNRKKMHASVEEHIEKPLVALTAK
ncbi:MAG TPA: protein kinase, partial [Chlamydiales bacterium]|nr:protein kinase [Chlamydiales bacterium]